MANAYEERNNTLYKMGFNSYREYLSSQIWRSIKRKFLFGACHACANKRAVVLHHKAYDEYTLRCGSSATLVPMCYDCHQAIEFDGISKNTLGQANRELAKVSEGGVDKALQLKKRIPVWRGPRQRKR